MISIITPTISRKTLAATLESAIPQMGKGDEYFILGDGEQPEARAMVEVALRGVPTYKAKHVHYVETKGGRSLVGNHQRNIAMRLAARGNYFVFLDDDDILLPDALKTIKQRIKEYPDTPLMFSMVYALNGSLVPAPGVNFILMGNVSGSCFVVKNDRKKLGKWPLGEYAGDFEFIKKTVEKNDFKLEWVRDPIVKIRPHVLTDPPPPPKPKDLPLPLDMQIDLIMKGL